MLTLYFQFLFVLLYIWQLLTVHKTQDMPNTIKKKRRKAKRNKQPHTPRKNKYATVKNIKNNKRLKKKKIASVHDGRQYNLIWVESQEISLKKETDITNKWKYKLENSFRNFVYILKNKVIHVVTIKLQKNSFLVSPSKYFFVLSASISLTLKILTFD